MFLVVSLVNTGDTKTRLGAAPKTVREQEGIGASFPECTELRAASFMQLYYFIFAICSTLVSMSGSL